ncbi:MAG: GGDEF domain-containing protein [Agathobacter sp.]|nr:GGDEF domain-containing protein [Agathobacter sp.]
MSKNIAILMGSINMEHQRHIMDGMIDATKERDCNIYIFTNHSFRQNNKESAQGAYQIMELPDFEYFDGVIVAPDTIQYPPVASFVMDKIRNSQIPYITLDRVIEGHGCLLTSSYDAQYKMVEHLIKEHNCKDIVYVRGPVGYLEADNRYQGYVDALNDNHIPFKEDNVFEGAFTLESGYQTAIKMNMMGLKPEAIACANDAMAVGVMEYFKMIGISVPKDVLLTGFDNSESAMYSNPSITSIDKNPHELGYRAIYEMLDILDGKESECIKVSTEPSGRESCGCGTADDIDINRLKYKYIQKDIYSNHLSEMINANLAQFSGLQSPEEVIPIVKQAIHRISLKAFYLCLCDTSKVFALPESNMGGDFDLQQVNTDYTEKMELPLAYEVDAIHSYKAFPKGMVLPKEIRERNGSGNYYVVTPIYFQNCCYGYAVSGNDKLALMNSLYYSWLMNIGVAFENIRKKMLLQDAVIKLNNVWSYDTLTHLYNRAGFYYEAKTILEIMKLQDSKIFVLFSDVDGLKKVNDTQGHEAGDALIKEMAACFKESLTGDMLAMRYGGDEFVVFGSYEDEAEINYLLQSLQNAMDRRNESGKNSFTLAASIGVTKYNAKDVKELSDLIDIADANMYEQKRKKREGRV